MRHSIGLMIWGEQIRGQRQKARRALKTPKISSPGKVVETGAYRFDSEQMQFTYNQKAELCLMGGKPVSSIHQSQL